MNIQMGEVTPNATLNVNRHENEEVEDSCNDSANGLNSQMISEIASKMVEKVNSVTNIVANQEKTSTKSPHKNIYLFGQNDLLKSPLFKSPIFKKWDKATESVDVVTGINTQRTRKISVNSDNDTFKSELCPENFSTFEHIDLLHDLDSVVKFEESKDNLLSTIMDTQDDDLLGVNRDPVTDPLFISDCEKKDTDILSDSDASYSKRHRVKAKSESQVRRRKSERLLNKGKPTLSKEEIRLLKELDNVDQGKEISLIDLNKLLELRIKLIHKVPPQHKIELTGSHAPTKRDKALIQKHGPIRKGLYTPIEDKIIRKNWDTFCKLHNWDTNKTEPFLHWRHNGRYYIKDIEERQKFIQFLANRLPWRTLYSVYTRFKVLYRHKITYTRYTSKEDKKILKYIKNEQLDKRSTKYSELAKLLGRTDRSVCKRYQYLKNQYKDKSEMGPLVDVRWTLPLIRKFIKTLLSVTISEDIKELKDATLPKPVWQKMEENLNIHENVLRTFWQHQLHLQLFSTSPIYLNDIKIQLIEYMYARGISNTREITWSNVAKYFDGATAAFLRKVFYYLVQKCEMNNTDNFADVVEHLYHTKIPEIQKAPTDKFLPRITYKNGKIFLLNTEKKKTVATDNYQETNSTNSTDS